MTKLDLGEEMARALWEERDALKARVAELELVLKRREPTDHYCLDCKQISYCGFCMKPKPCGCRKYSDWVAIQLCGNHLHASGVLHPSPCDVKGHWRVDWGERRKGERRMRLEEKSPDNSMFAVVCGWQADLRISQRRQRPGDGHCQACEREKQLVVKALAQADADSIADQERLRDSKNKDLLEAAERERKLLALMKPLQEAACSMLCPSVWKTGERPPHVPLCEQARRALGETEAK